MVATGVQMLIEGGLGSGAERITLRGAFEHLEKERGIRLYYASVLGRVWNSQQEFQRDVAVAVASIDGSASESEATIAGFLNILRKSDRSTIEGRWRAINRFCLYVGEASLNDLVESPTWPIWLGIWAVSTSNRNTPDNDLVRTALAKSYQGLTANYEFAFDWVISLLGLRVKAPLTTAHLATAISALAEGCGLRDALQGSQVRGIKLPTGKNGRKESWTIFGVGLEALCHHFFEEIPDWEPSELNF